MRSVRAKWVAQTVESFAEEEALLDALPAEDDPATPLSILHIQILRDIAESGVYALPWRLLRRLLIARAREVTRSYERESKGLTACALYASADGGSKPENADATRAAGEIAGEASEAPASADGGVPGAEGAESSTAVATADSADSTPSGPLRKRARTGDAEPDGSLGLVDAGVDAAAASTSELSAVGGALFSLSDAALEALSGIAEALLDPKVHAAPWTLQRLCETLTTPRRYFSKIKSFLAAIITLVTVDSRVHPVPVSARLLPPGSGSQAHPLLIWGPRSKPAHVHANTPAPISDPGVSGYVVAMPRSSFAHLGLKSGETNNAANHNSAAATAAAAAAAAAAASATFSHFGSGNFDGLAALQSLYSDDYDSDEDRAEHEEWKLSNEYAASRGDGGSAGKRDFHMENDGHAADNRSGDGWGAPVLAAEANAWTVVEDEAAVPQSAAGGGGNLSSLAGAAGFGFRSSGRSGGILSTLAQLNRPARPLESAVRETGVGTYRGSDLTNDAFILTTPPPIPAGTPGPSVPPNTLAPSSSGLGPPRGGGFNLEEAVDADANIGEDDEDIFPGQGRELPSRESPNNR